METFQIDKHIPQANLGYPLHSFVHTAIDIFPVQGPKVETSALSRDQCGTVGNLS